MSLALIYQKYICIYICIYLSYLHRSLAFFLAECDKQDEVDKCWLYFFISSNLSLFFLSIPYDCMFTEGKQGNTYRKGICQATHVLRLDSTKQHYGIIGIPFFVFFFQVCQFFTNFFSQGTAYNRKGRPGEHIRSLPVSTLKSCYESKCTVDHYTHTWSHSNSLHNININTLNKSKQNNLDILIYSKND